MQFFSGDGGNVLSLLPDNVVRSLVPCRYIDVRYVIRLVRWAGTVFV